MEALSAADRFVALLRQKLAERAQTKAASGKRAGAVDRAAPTVAPRPISELAAQAGADDRSLRRTIVEQLLTEHLGTDLVNEPRFQQVVERVTELIAADDQLASVLAEVMGEVRQ